MHYGSQKKSGFDIHSAPAVRITGTIGAFEILVPFEILWKIPSVLVFFQHYTVSINTQLSNKPWAKSGSSSAVILWSLINDTGAVWSPQDPPLPLLQYTWVVKRPTGSSKLDTYWCAATIMFKTLIILVKHSTYFKSTWLSQSAVIYTLDYFILLQYHCAQLLHTEWQLVILFIKSLQQSEGTRPEILIRPQLLIGEVPH